MKDSVTILIANFSRLHRERYQPDRDLILALTADEENGPDDGVDWLVKNHRELLNLDQTASANVNCRILPGHSPEEVRQDLSRIFNDLRITVRYGIFAGRLFDSPPNLKSFAPLSIPDDVIHPIEQIAAQMWPGTPVIPEMETGASDSVYTLAAGIPTYGISGIALDNDDIRAHGRDERISVDSLYNGFDFVYFYLKALTEPRAPK